MSIIWGCKMLLPNWEIKRAVVGFGSRAEDLREKAKETVSWGQRESLQKAKKANSEGISLPPDLDTWTSMHRSFLRPIVSVISQPAWGEFHFWGLIQVRDSSILFNFDRSNMEFCQSASTKWSYASSLIHKIKCQVFRLDVLIKSDS